MLKCAEVLILPTNQTTEHLEMNLNVQQSSPTKLYLTDFKKEEVESKKQIDMVNIIDGDIWNAEPALRPEDEMLLRKLHDMLQTTADDLKLLSGELSKYHEPGVQMKTLSMPLDEEFNEKVHIEEVVNAKFYGNKLVDKTQPASIKSQTRFFDRTLGSTNIESNTKDTTNASVKTSDLSKLKKPPIKNKLQISRTHVMDIKEKNSDEKQTETHKIGRSVSAPKKYIPSPLVAYNEISHKYNQPDIKKATDTLQIQRMPSVNIRGELKLQNVLQLNILPENKESGTQQLLQHNALVIEMHHDPPLKQTNTNSIKFDDSQYIKIATHHKPTRKVSTMTAYESSDSNNISSDTQHRLQRYGISIPHRPSTSTHKLVRNTEINTVKKGTDRTQVHLEEWRRRLNAVYGKQLTHRISDVKKKKVCSKNVIKKTNVIGKTKENKEKNVQNQINHGLNNTEYIPYSKLTLGGVNVSDIEREISNIPDKQNIVLSPILDKILSSRENSFHHDSPQKGSHKKSLKILTTSDENLLQEVLDIEMKVTNTLNKDAMKPPDTVKNDVNDTKENSYADDFEEDKSDASEDAKDSNSKSETSKSSQNLPSDENEKPVVFIGNKSVSNLTFTKVPSLSLKNKVDIFEFVHSVDTHETGTQSNVSNKIAPKETQTSPRDDKPNVQPIHNDLWPSIDPRGEVEKMLKLEKDFIKKLIINEYGDLVEKSFNKPSTSKQIEIENIERNVNASQKITQTSPAHVKSVMTSPTRTKTRTTSPFALTAAVHQQTSPMCVVPNEEELKIDLENDEDLGISANMSSPRFSLRLPRTSRDVLSKLDTKVQNSKQKVKYDNLLKQVFSSSSSVDGDYSSSDISSLGEINKKFKRLRKSRIPSISEISSSSSLSKYSSGSSGPILPLRSEGEVSIRQPNRKKANQLSKSEGEISLGQMR